MKFDAVQRVCRHLTPFQKNALWKLIGQESEGPTPDTEVSNGVALCYWAADWVFGAKFVDQDRLRLWIQTFSPTLLTAGNHVVLKRMRFKIGFMDEKLAVMDGCDTFLNLETGSTVKAIESLRPCRLISDDLGVVVGFYMQSSGGIIGGKEEAIKGHVEIAATAQDR